MAGAMKRYPQPSLRAPEGPGKKKAVHSGVRSKFPHACGAELVLYIIVSSGPMLAQAFFPGLIWTALGITWIHLDSLGLP